MSAPRINALRQLAEEAELERRDFLYESTEQLRRFLDANQKRLSDFHLEIWRYAETAFREYRSARAYCDLLRKEGFQVEEGSADMPTA